MLQFKIKVILVKDERRDLPVKDKNGIPTQLTKSYRFVTIQGMVHDNDLKMDRPAVVKSVDPTWECPKPGSEFVTPEVRRYEIDPQTSQPVITV